MTGGRIVSRYERDGYVVIPQVIDPELVAEVQGHVEWLECRHPDVRPEQFHHRLIVDDPFWIRLCTDDRLIDLIEPSASRARSCGRGSTGRWMNRPRST